MSDVTYILGQIESGDSQAAEKLLPLVYDELRKFLPCRRSADCLGLYSEITGNGNLSEDSLSTGAVHASRSHDLSRPPSRWLKQAN